MAVLGAALCALLAGEAQGQTGDQPGSALGPFGAVSGVVYDSINGEPLENAAVFLWDTPHRAASDVDGRFRLDSIPVGEYSLLFFHTRLGEVGVSVGPKPIRIRANEEITVELGTPSMFTLVATGCLMDPHPDGTGVVAGWVGDGDSGMGLPGAQVTLSWNVEGSSEPEQVDLATDAAGWYRVCEAPAAVPMMASVQFLDRQAFRREVTARNRGIAEAGFLLLELEPTRVAGHLQDAASGDAVSNATVWLRGTSFRTLTDGRGAFTFDAVPPGSYMLMVDHLAYGTKMDTLKVPSAQRISVEMRVDTRAIEMAPLTVEVEAIPVPDRGRGGIHISAAAVERVRFRSRDAADVVRSQNLPGVIVRRRADGSLCIGYAPGQVRMMFNDGCVPMMIFINDAKASNTDLVLQMPPDAIERIVIYKPVEAGNLFGLDAANGVMVIYTKGNGRD